MIVLDGNLGVRNDLSLQILKSLDADIKEFRAKYKPYDHDYKISQQEDHVQVTWPEGSTKFSKSYLHEVNLKAWLATCILTQNSMYANVFLETFLLALTEDQAYLMQALYRLKFPCLIHRKAASCWSIRYRVL